jgi:CHAD domain-containing protein
VAAANTGEKPAGRVRRTPSRAFRLLSDEPLGKGIARIAHGRIGHALDELGGATESSPEEAVHEARKDVKKLRALLRLVGSGTSGRVRRRENEALRDVGRSLSGVRDADVMLATLADLEEGFPGDLPPEAAGALREQLEAHRRGMTLDGAESAALELARIRDRVRTWTPRGDDVGVVRQGLERGYRRGRRALREARREPTAENLHEWRKRAKDHWYNLGILRDVWPPVMEPLADAAHQLSERLGEDHDLEVLLDFARSRAIGLDGADRVVALTAVVESRREGLRAEAFALGERLYAEKPRAFAGRVESLWHTWRSHSAA